jgi:hypothetical protein
MAAVGFVAVPATAPNHVGFGRCSASAEIWAAAGVRWWGQAVLISVEPASATAATTPHVEGVPAYASAGHDGQDDGRDDEAHPCGQHTGIPHDGHKASERATTIPHAADVRAAGSTERAADGARAIIHVWCTAWPLDGASAVATVDLSVVGSTAGSRTDSAKAMAQEDCTTRVSAVVALLSTSALRCSVVKVAQDDPLPLSSIVVEALEPVSAAALRDSGFDTARAKRALRGKPIAVGCTACINWFGSGGSSNARGVVSGGGGATVHSSSTASDGGFGTTGLVSLVVRGCTPPLDDGALGCVTHTTIVTAVEGAAAGASGVSSPLRGANMKLLPRKELPPGLENACRELESLVRLPLLHAAVFAELGVECPKGVLLHGPPGTGKTLLARTVAEEAGAAFISIDGPELFAPYLGESEANLRRVFGDAQRRATAGCCPSHRFTRVLCH